MRQLRGILLVSGPFRPCRTGIRAALLIAVALTVGCSSRPFKISQLAKSEIDLVADAHVQQVNALLEELMVKLYKRNPDQMARGAGGDL